MTSHNTDPLGNDGPKTVTPALEVGLVDGAGKDISRAGVEQPRLRIVIAELVEANALVALWHRHHEPAVGHRFSVAVIEQNTGRVCGAAIVGRPVARLAGSPRGLLEVTRLVVDGTPNACSALYGAAARVGKGLGAERIQTYVLDEETGTSLRAAGWEYEGPAGGGQWKHTDGKPRRTDQPTGLKGRWSKRLNPPVPDLIWPDFGGPIEALDLFGEAS